MKNIFIFWILFLQASLTQAFTLVTTNPNQTGWGDPKIVFKLNPANCPSNIDEILKMAVAIWNGIPTSALYVEVKGLSSATPAQIISGSAPESPVIACDTNLGTSVGYDPNYVAGVGGVRGSANPLTYGYLLLNVAPGAGANIGNFSVEKAASIAAHELGHSMGLGHSADVAALMYYDATQKVKLSLAQDDVDAMTYLYPRDETGKDKLFGCASVVTKSPPGAGPPPTNLAKNWPVVLSLFLPLILLIAFRSEWAGLRRST